MPRNVGRPCRNLAFLMRGWPDDHESPARTRPVDPAHVRGPGRRDNRAGPRSGLGIGPAFEATPLFADGTLYLWAIALSPSHCREARDRSPRAAQGCRETKRPSMIYRKMRMTGWLGKAQREMKELM
jgi:hypothetical protein